MAFVGRASRSQCFGSMKLPLRWLALAWLLPITISSAIERLPIEEFAREPDTSQARLSPDGRHYAFLADHVGVTKIHVADINNAKIVRFNLGGAALLGGVRKEVMSFDWVNANRLIVLTKVWDTFFGVMATDRDGGRTVAISGYEDEKIHLQSTRSFAREIIHRFNDEAGTVLMLDRHEGGVGKPNRPDILRVDTTTGLSSVIVKNPGEVGHWGVDFEGVPRFGLLTHGDLSGAIYRDTEKEPWRTILPLQNRKGEMRVAGFDAAGNRLLVTMLNEEKRWTIFPLDPATAAIGEPLLSDPVYDIVPDRGLTGSAGVALAGTLFSLHKRSLAGIRYYTESPRMKWFDPEYATYQKAVDKALPDTVNVLSGSSVDGKQMLWFAFSDQNPGAYYLTDQEKRSFRMLAPRMSWIKPAQMASMLSVKYTARDGLVIHGYLSVPPGYEPKGLPLIVMPHGGPWVRDVWGFNPLVQMLANRGYAVLQMNYRGSPGYGDELFRKAKQQIGRQIQTDIEDGTRWAIAAGVADPKRIAIMGQSYGGYSALFGLGKTPDLYRCGISFAGVTDWPAIYTDSDGAESKEAKKYWREQIGDPSADAAMLQSISPVNFASEITAPVLIIQGRKDRRVPQDQAKRMVAALEKAGRKPETLFLGDVAHNFGPEKRRIEIYQRIASFLETHLGPGVP
jgi:dipeptidyl aminopeptidase/acylaminoacyl peptidase